MVSENSDRDQPDYQGPDRAHHRFRYGAWHGGPDPLKPPFDVREAIDRIGQDVLSAGTVRDALRDLMRRGVDGRGGLDRLAEKIRKLRAQARRRGDLGLADHLARQPSPPGNHARGTHLVCAGRRLGGTRSARR